VALRSLVFDRGGRALFLVPLGVAFADAEGQGGLSSDWQITRPHFCDHAHAARGEFGSLNLLLGFESFSVVLRAIAS
jgi:hypothetical protein